MEEKTMTDIMTIPAIAAIVYTIIDITKTAFGGDEKFKRFIPSSPLCSARIGSFLLRLFRGWLKRRTSSWRL
jgi:hypothetical protein